MSPQQAHSLVGHSPQTRDIVERLRAEGDSCRDVCVQWETANCMQSAADEIERLRTALRSVRACTDPAWIAQIVKDALRETP